MNSSDRQARGPDPPQGGGVTGRNSRLWVIAIRFSVRHVIAALCALVAVLALAAPVSAQECTTESSVTLDQYGEVVDRIEAGTCTAGGGGGGDPADPGTATDPGTAGLPFTGLDVGLMGVAAVGLVGAGVLLRRRAHGSEGV